MKILKKYRSLNEFSLTLKNSQPPKIFRGDIFESQDIVEINSKYIHNLTNNIKVETLKSSLKSAYTTIKSYNNPLLVKVLDEISALSTHLNTKDDKIVIDEICKRLALLSKNNTAEHNIRALAYIEQLATIPVHSREIASPVQSRVLYAYKEFLEKYKIIGFLKKYIFSSTPKQLTTALKHQRLLTVLSPKRTFNRVSENLAHTLSGVSNQSNDFSDELKGNLYKNYYLKGKTTEFQNILKLIQEKYGTFVFVPDSKNINQLRKLLNEFERWEKAGGNRVKYEKILDYCELDSLFNDFVTSGYADNDGLIRMRSFNTIELDVLLRHEKMHINDNLDSADFGYFGKNKEYDFTEGGEILSKKQWYRDELIKAGLPKSWINYAYTDRGEFIAVAAMGDTTKYSPKFKQALVEIGMPEWFFNMK